jgi:hypothetical protein
VFLERFLALQLQCDDVFESIAAKAIKEPSTLPIYSVVLVRLLATSGRLTNTF